MSGKSRTLVACCILGFLAACSGDNRPADNSTSHGDSSGDGLALVADDEALYVAVGQRIERRDLVDVSRVAAVIDDTSTLPARRGTIGALHVQNGVLTWTRDLVDSAGADREADEPPAQLLRASTRGGERPTVLLEDASGSIVAVHHGARGISGCMGALNVPGRAFFIGRNDDGTFAPARMFDLAVVPNWGTRHFYCGELYDIEDGGFFVNIKRRPWGDESVWVRFSLDPSVLPEVGVEPPREQGGPSRARKGDTSSCASSMVSERSWTSEAP